MASMLQMEFFNIYFYMKIVVFWLKFNSLYENCCILIQISPKFVLKDPVKNKQALVQRIAWLWASDKSLSEANNGLVH